MKDRSTCLICLLIWFIFIMSGTIYLIVTYDWSRWWLLLALLIVHATKCEEGDD